MILVTCKLSAVSNEAQLNVTEHLSVASSSFWTVSITELAQNQ